MRLATLLVLMFASWATISHADQELVFDTDAVVNTGRITSCLRRPHNDPRRCIAIEAAACYDRPSNAPNASIAAMRCDYAEMNFWQGLLETYATPLSQNLRGTSLRAFEDQQALWEQTDTLCGFPFNVMDTPLWPEAEITHCDLNRLAERALQVRSYVTDYLDYCEFPAADIAPGFICNP